MIVSVLANIPIGVFLAFGSSFFTLWVPSQDAVQLTILSSLSLLGMLFAGLSQCFVNIFGVVNRLKLNSLVVIGSGFINLGCVFLLLKFTNLGIFSVVAASSTISIIRIFCFTIPYSAILINASWRSFAFYLIKGASNVLVPLMVGFLICHFIEVNSWTSLLICFGLTAILALAIDCFVVLDKNQREVIIKKLHIIK